MLILDSSRLSCWLEETIKLNDAYRGLGYDERDAMKLTIEEVTELFNRWRLVISENTD